MKITRGGIYILKDEYVDKENLLISKRPIVVLNSEKQDSFISAVRIGAFKSITDDAHNLYIELRIKGNRYFSTILCDKVLEFPKNSLKEEIGILDEATLRIVENKLFNKENNTGYAIYDDSKSNDADIIKDQTNNFSVEESDKADDISNEEIVQANVVVEDMVALEDVIFNTNEMVELLREIELKKENERRRQKKYKWIWVIISNVTSFFLGILASYIANHWDAQISTMIEKVKYFFIELF